MGYYPIFLELNVRSCIVIGGGCIGERKADELLEVGVDGAVISPTISERLRDLLAKDSITSPGTGLPRSRFIA
jgi:siroheme synthase (precorrin-2 oxidase/ferrochelatase)